jgi:hypothetical protein
LHLPGPAYTKLLPIGRLCLAQAQLDGCTRTSIRTDGRASGRDRGASSAAGLLHGCRLAAYGSADSQVLSRTATTSHTPTPLSWLVRHSALPKFPVLRIITGWRRDVSTISACKKTIATGHGRNTDETRCGACMLRHGEGGINYCEPYERTAGFRREVCRARDGLAIDGCAERARKRKPEMNAAETVEAGRSITCARVETRLLSLVHAPVHFCGGRWDSTGNTVSRRLGW